MIHLIYPEDRYVTEDQIKVWHGDAVANGDVGMYGPHETPTLDDMIFDLEDIGFITVKDK